MWETEESWVWSLWRDDPLEEGVATHSSIPAWRNPWTVEPGRLQSIRSHRVWDNSSDLAHTQAPYWASLVAQLVKNAPAMREAWVGKIRWRKERLPTSVFWPGEFHALYSPWGHKESDMTEWLSFSFFLASYLLYPFIYRWTFRLLLCPGRAVYF